MSSKPRGHSQVSYLPSIAFLPSLKVSIPT
jgi:hypothetical protein